MFIDDDTYKAKLEHNQNLINILNPIVGSDMTDIIRRKVTPVLSDKDIEDVLDKGVKINSDGKTRHIGQQGKVEGDSNIPQVLRNVIGIQANFDKTNAVAKQWGVSTVEVNNLKNGIVNATRGPEDPANKATSNAVETAINRVTDKVIGRIEKALDCITDDKLVDKEAKELSNIISNLSRVMPSMRKDKDNGTGNNVQVVFMTPSIADAPVFKTIDV